MKQESKKLFVCCLSYRYEVLGLVLLVLASLITLVTASDLGLLGMFLVGVILVCLKHVTMHNSCQAHEEAEELADMVMKKEEKKSAPKKVAKPKAAKKPQTKSS